MIGNIKRTPNQIVQECSRILKNQSIQNIQKWISDNKITSLNLRNKKSAQLLNEAYYLMQKMFVNQSQKQQRLITFLSQYHKKNPTKCFQFCRLLKYFTQWDYEFEYIYNVATDKPQHSVGLYLTTRQLVVWSDYNKGNKQLLSGVTAQLQQWASIVRNVFKNKQEDDIIDLFTTTVKEHYIQIKKSQTQKINGAQFLRICHIMNQSEKLQQKTVDLYQINKKQSKQKQGQEEGLIGIFNQALLTGLSTQDKQLIRVLSYRDKNIARMLQQKHTKMVHLIGDQVNNLRKDINKQKQRYIEVVEQKNSLVRLMQRIKQVSLRYIIERSEHYQLQLLQLLQSFNKKHNPKSSDVSKTLDIINNRRLIQIIQREQLQKD